MVKSFSHQWKNPLLTFLIPNFRDIQHQIWISLIQLWAAMPWILRSKAFDLHGIVFYRRKHFGLFFSILFYK